MRRVLLDNCHSLLGWLRQTNSRPWWEWVAERLADEEKMLIQADAPEIYRLQGRVALLREIQSMPKELQEYVSKQAKSQEEAINVGR